MATSRRDFLKKGSLVALAAGVPMSVAGKVSANALSDAAASGFHLNQADFAAQLNTKFEIGTKPVKIAANLVAVSDLPSKTPERRREGFSLLFKADRTRLLKQNTYVLNHNKLGTFSLLLVPMASKDDSSIHYEAVINRLYP